MHVLSHRFPRRFIHICHFQTKHESEKLTTQRFRGAGTLFSPHVRHKIPYPNRRAHLAKVRRHTGGRRLWSGGAAFMFSRIVYLFLKFRFHVNLGGLRPSWLLMIECVPNNLPAKKKNCATATCSCWGKIGFQVLSASSERESADRIPCNVTPSVHASATEGRKR